MLKYVANNSAIFIPYIPEFGQSSAYILTDLECASGTTSSSPDQLLFITPTQYQDQLNNALVYEPGHWKLQIGGWNYSVPLSFTGGVFTCRMPDENGAVVDTSVGIFLENYGNSSKWISLAVSSDCIQLYSLQVCLCH